LTVLAAVMMYYYITSTGGFDKRALGGLDHLKLESFADTATSVTPVAAPPTYGQGNLTNPAYAGCTQTSKCDGPLKFTTDELLDAQIITQKISEYDTTYGEDFNPADSAYAHERFMVDDSLGPDVLDSHQQWAQEARAKSVSLSSLVTPFDPDEALSGDGIRHAKPKAPKDFGLLDFGS
jgi:hypothetical protein